MNLESFKEIKINDLTVIQLNIGDNIIWKKEDPQPTEIPNNEIWYTTTDGLTAQTTNLTGVTSLETMGLVSNTYVDGKGIMKFSKDVTSIGERSFYICTSLTSVEIPNSVTSIGDNAFAYCSGLSSVEIPNSVTSIGSSVFYNCVKLTSVTIPNSVISIGNSAFYYCTKLSSVTIPNSVTSIGNTTFAYCSGLSNINYNGTKAQFTSITKGSNWKYNVPTSCIVHCTDGDYPISNFK